MESRSTNGPKGLKLPFAKFPSKTGEKPIWICSSLIKHKAEAELPTNGIVSHKELREGGSGGSSPIPALIPKVIPPPEPTYPAKPGHVITNTSYRVLVTPDDEIDPGNRVDFLPNIGILGTRIVQVDEESMLFDKQILLRFSTRRNYQINEYWVSVESLSEAFLTKIHYTMNNDNELRKYRWLSKVLDMKPSRNGFLVQVKFQSTEKEIWLTERELMKFIRKVPGCSWEKLQQETD